MGFGNAKEIKDDIKIEYRLVREFDEVLGLVKDPTAYDDTSGDSMY